jgi:ribonucleoside-diphosphate reductase alpha chain
VISLQEITVIKRDGKKEKFSILKLRTSILKALEPLDLSEYIDDLLEEIISNISSIKVISTREISDRVEMALIQKVVSDQRFEEAAKYYALARLYNDVFGKGKWKTFDEVDRSLSYAAIRVLQSRYLMKNPNTLRALETPKMMFWRVAKSIAAAEDSEEDKRKWSNEFFRILSQRKFIPNSPTLMNAGTRLGILSACFVIPVRDAMVTPDGEGIYDAVRAQAIVFQQGGGCGFDFSELRPEGDIVASTAGVASGPLSFMRVFDVNTDVIKQGGRRRGANMGVLHIWHPDILKFIKAKSGKMKELRLQNFNISVGIYDEFMKQIVNGGKFPLVNPRLTSLDKSKDSRCYAMVVARHRINEEWVQMVIIDELEEKGGSISLDESLIVTWDEAIAIAESENAIVGYLDPAEVFDEITKSAWDSGDPGLVFIDTMNRRHPTWYLGKINATNPCGEQPLLPWESCNLGSINLEKYVVYHDGKASIDWEGMASDLKVIARFMDNVLNVARYPLTKLGEAAKKTRKIGVGVMGWAHMLIKLGIKYDSADALCLAYYLAEWIEYNLALASIELAKEKGSFPAYRPDLYRPAWMTAKKLDEIFSIAGIKENISEEVRNLIEKRPEVDWGLIEKLRKRYGMRNAALTSIAPTGTISIIAGTSSSIEPIFALAFTRMVTVGTFIEVNQLFLNDLRKYGLDEPEVIETVAETGSIAHNPFMPRKLRNIYRTAHDVDPIWHVLHQAVWQQWICAAVSKTVNMRSEASVDDVKKVYMLAWLLGCKGITVYRDKSKSQQVIHFGVKLSKKLLESRERREAVVGYKHMGEDTQLEDRVAGRESKDKSTGVNHGIKAKQQAIIRRRGSRYRIRGGFVLKEGDVGDCSTCEY